MTRIKKQVFDTYHERLTWLLRLRFVLIIIVSFLLSLSLFKSSLINFEPGNIRTLIVLNTTALIVNFILLFYQNYIIEWQHIILDENHFNYLSLIHIDFDIVYIILLIALTGGLHSRFLFFMMYNIITTTFLISGFRSYFYSFLVLFLLALTSISFYIVPSFPYINFHMTNPVPEMTFISIIYIFAVYISKYVSSKLYEKQVELNLLYEETYHLSITDRLTGLYDQTYFRIAASDALEIAKVNHNAFAIVMMDLDDFKSFNDNNGHLSGSRALQEIAQIIRQSFRKTDILAKYGGDEFIMLMRDIDEDYIIPTLKRFQNKLESYDFNPGGEGFNTITASIGISVFPCDGDNLHVLMKRADRALYHVKNKGKNGLLLYKDIEE